jgi:hypothetical protein
LHERERVEGKTKAALASTKRFRRQKSKLVCMSEKARDLKEKNK